MASLSLNFLILENILVSLKPPTRKTRNNKRFCLSQEKSNLEPWKEQDRRGTMVKNRSVEKNGTLTSESLKFQQNTLPPLVDALKASAEQDAATFHFPGHNRGRAAPSSLTQLIGLRPFVHDLSEIPELDNLFSPGGPILKAQREAAKLFGASETWFLVGGTTCGIQAAILATCSPGESLILSRNSHLSATSAMILSGAVPKYTMPEYDSVWDIAGETTPMQVEKAIKELEIEGKKPAAILVTSPTYQGVCSNLREICKLCHSFGVPVIVDEAHGAHFGFHPKLPHSALSQGADIAAQSTHKVLCSLTQSSMLHTSGTMVDREKISRCLQTLQTTSPSYLLLASLDAARAQLSENPENIFNKAVHLAMETKAIIRPIPGVSILEPSSFKEYVTMDPLRLTLGFRELGLSGYQADDFLYEDHGIICELVGTQSLTFAFNLGTCKDHVQRLVLGLKELSTRSSQVGNAQDHVGGRKYAPFSDTTVSLSPRDAFFANKRRVSTVECVGNVCGELICPYPPGIPVLYPGETITEDALDYILNVMRDGAVVVGASDPLLSTIVICDT